MHFRTFTIICVNNSKKALDKTLHRGNAEDIKPYTDPTFANNVILTQTERLTMNSRPKDPKTARNKNVLVVGGSGSGKTTPCSRLKERFWRG